MASTENKSRNICLVWLEDTEFDTQMKIINIQEQMSDFVNQLKIFNNKNDCKNYIESLSTNESIIFIVNDQLGKTMVPDFHKLEQILSIYIYEPNKQIEKEWLKNYIKVRGVVTKFDQLIEKIQIDLNEKRLNRMTEPFKFNVFNMNSIHETSTVGLNGDFLHFQLLISCFLRMRSAENDKNELIRLTRQQYKDDEHQLKVIDQFEKEYSSDRAIWWYTRESFLYRQLNRTLRTQNIDGLFVFRFFIRDLEKQLEQNQYLSSIQLFRGQLLSNEELLLLKNSIGQLISMNSFLSTSIDRLAAISFLYSSTTSDRMQRVLFEIDADPNQTGIKPFSKIDSLSYFPGEGEVLMMLGSVFRIIDIDQDNKKIWILKLKLCHNNDPGLQAVFSQIKTEDGDAETTLLSIGIELSRMGKYDEAEKYYLRLLDEMPLNHPDRSSLYHDLGNLYDVKGDYKSSVEWHEKALSTMKQTLNPNNEKIGTSYNSIAAVHAKMGEFEKALDTFTKAYNIWRETLGDDHPNIGQCLSNIAGIYQIYGKYSDALAALEKAMIIYGKHLPANHPQIADLYNNIGTVHLCFGQFDLAFEHLEKSLKIKEKCLPSQHPDIAMTYTNIALIFENKGEYPQALAYMTKAIDIYHRVLYSNHPTVVRVEQLMKRVSEKVKENN